MSERTLYIIQTDINGIMLPQPFNIPDEVVDKIVFAISEDHGLINMVFHDRKSGNFYKAVYSI